MHLPDKPVSLSVLSKSISIDGVSPYTIKTRYADFPKGIEGTWNNMPCTRYNAQEIIDFAKTKGLTVSEPTPKPTPNPQPPSYFIESYGQQATWNKERKELLLQIEVLQRKISCLKPKDTDLLDLQSLLARRFKHQARCGIYFLFNDDELVYIGQSVNIDSRIQTHNQEKKKTFDSYAYILCERDMLNSLETRYILHYKPKYNITEQGHLSIPMSKYHFVDYQ